VMSPGIVCDLERSKSPTRAKREEARNGISVKSPPDESKVPATSSIDGPRALVKRIVGESVPGRSAPIEDGARSFPVAARRFSPLTGRSSLGSASSRVFPLIDVCLGAASVTCKCRTGTVGVSAKPRPVWG
jgi:hypothetical protein